MTISREYGAHGRAVPRHVADRLGYRLVDDDLPVVVAARLGTSPELVETVEQSRGGFARRLLRSLIAASPETFAPAHPHEDLSEATVRETERLIREAADAGNVVIVGRMGNAVLAPRPDLVRVFLSGPLAWRAGRIMKSLGVNEAEARAEIARVDAGRRAFAREHYDFAWGDPHHYDLVLDVSTFDVGGSVALIAAAVEART